MIGTAEKGLGVQQVARRAFRSCILVSAALVAAPALSQESDADNVMVYGRMYDWTTGDALPTGTVTIASGTLPERSVHTDTTGWYELFLELGHDHHLRYAAEGYVTKHVEIDTRGIPLEEQEGGYGMNVEMKLFRPLEGVDLSFLGDLIGVARYVPADGELAWDTVLTAQMRSRVQRAMLEADSLRTARAKLAEEERIARDAQWRQVGTWGGVLFALLGLAALVFWQQRRRVR